MSPALNSFGASSELRVGDRTYDIFRLDVLERAGVANVGRLPYSIRILLENLLRYEDGFSVTKDDVVALASWSASNTPDKEIPFRPARVLMQDFTGVPCVVDLAAMRDAMNKLGADSSKINPLVPVHLVIDHSVMVDEFGTPKAFEQPMLPQVEGEKAAQTELQGAGDVKHVEGTAAERRGVLAAQLAGTLERGAPQQVGLDIAPFREILVERGQGVVLGIGGDVTAEDRKADAVHDLGAAVVRHGERAFAARAPGAHRSRFPLVDVELQQRARVDVRRLSARHGSPREGPSPPPR